MKIYPGQKAAFASPVEFYRPGLSYKILILALAVSYGAILAGLPLEAFKDRANYLVYASSSWEILLRYMERGPLVLLSNEPLWLLVNAGLSKIFSSEAVVRLIIFAPATAVAWTVLHRDPRQFAWLVLFLLMPQVLIKHIVHLRQGVAIAIFLLGWFNNHRVLRWLLLAMTPFFHSAFFFMILLLAATHAMYRLRLAADLRTVVFSGLGAGIGLSLGWLASLAGARQAQHYDFAMTDVSGFGFIFWTMAFGIMCMQGRIFVRRYAFELGIILFYLGTYFFIEVTGRIFECGLILVLIAGLRLSGWRRLAFLSLIVVYTAIQYALRLNQPWLGFSFK